MADTIKTAFTGKSLDRTLLAFAEAESEDNKGLILYIRNGELDFDTEENLFSVATLS